MRYVFVHLFGSDDRTAGGHCFSLLIVNVGRFLADSVMLL